MKRHRCLESVFCGLWFFVAPIASRDVAAQDQDRVQEIYDQFSQEATEYSITDSNHERVELRVQPLMNWANPERYDKLGSIFIWEQAGQPLAIGTVFSYSVRGSPRRKLALHSLADGPLTAKAADGSLVWSPSTAGVTRHSFPAGVGAATSAAQRMIRMRQLARQFKVTQTDDKGNPSVLRLLPQPVLRYASADHGIQDGAIFGWMIGTDPDAFLLIELNESGTWQYAFARFHFWKVAAEKNGEVVWDAAAELDQKANKLGNTFFQGRVYSSMVIPIRE